jgi:formylglycine-generating enzyme required for sulfatase activity/predicted Ser/Thr protein kinase
MRCLKCSIPLAMKNGIAVTMKICPSCEQNLPSLVNTLPRGTKLAQGKYQVEYVLGKGGFGITYYAVGHDKKQYIVKEYCPAENVARNKTGGLTPSRYVIEFQQGKKKFIYEAKTLDQFTDSNIARTINSFEENNTAYMVMEFIEGKRLSQELKEVPTGKKLSDDRVTEIVDVLVKVLSTVHAKGVYHLDIKPENVIRTDDGRIMLVDFGSCRQVKFGSKSLRTFDPRYAPPELIAANGTVGAYSDVFELGMLLHTLLVGKPADSSFERFFVPTKDPIDPGLPPDRASLIRSAIALQPSERHQSVGNWWRKMKGGEGERVKEDEKKKEGEQKKEGEEKKGLLTFEFKTAQVKLVGSSSILTTDTPGKAKYFVENLGHGVTLDMVYVPGGQLHMGSLVNDNERPQHTVEVPAFYLSKYPITQAQYLQFIGINNSHFGGSLQLPIESVSWNEAKAFCDKLAERTNKAYSLPSEAQWEYACRANTKTPFYFGQKISADLANYDASSYYDTYGVRGKERKTTTNVGTFLPNSFGLYDLYGNVWEWCLDTWHQNYNGAPKDGSAWVEKTNNNYRMVRGSSWKDYAASCRSAHRNKSAPETKANNIGFRIALPIRRVP